MAVNNHPLCIILPCAGEGKRLGLNYPKELYRIAGHIRLIDFSLRHILEYRKQKDPCSCRLTVCVVIVPGKESVAEYVQRQLHPQPVRRVYFNRDFHEWPGSVYSARDYYQSRNLVLLPDSFLDLGGSRFWWNAHRQSLLELTGRALAERPVFFGYIREHRSRRLRRLGALQVTGNRVVGIQDKPVEHFDRYNAYWGCYGFTRSCAGALYRVLDASVRRQNPVYSECGFYPATAVPMADFRDLGTWDAIADFRKNRKTLMTGFKLQEDQ